MIMGKGTAGGLLFRVFVSTYNLGTEFCESSIHLIHCVFAVEFQQVLHLIKELVFISELLRILILSVILIRFT